MATSQQFLVCDSSTLANFKQWAQAISAWFGTAGWSQSSDTGQVNWSTIGAVPGSGAFVYEIWQPNDGLTNFFLKVEYGNISGTNAPSLRVSLAYSTNGAGTPTGIFIGPLTVNNNAFTAPSTTIQYECNFSGAPGRIGVMMWRNAPSNQGQEFFAVERSLDASGSPTNTYVTVWTAGLLASAGRSTNQCTIVAGVGVAPSAINGAVPGGGQWVNRLCYFGAGVTTSFNGKIPMDMNAPMIGYLDNLCTVCGVAATVDIVEGVPLQATLYGATRTFLPSKIGPFGQVGGMGGAGVSSISALLMRFD